jgi:uncharacterized protein YhbP (UPF0306 family)
MSVASKTIPIDVLEYLRLHHIITLGTTSFTGMPHAFTVAYANDQSAIYFVTVEGSRAVRNINDNRYVSFTIDDYTTEWRKIRELQGVGSCTELVTTARAIGLDNFAGKFGASVALPDGLVFGIQPFEMHFVDYTYEAMTSAEVTRRSYQIDDTTNRPSQAAVATDLNRRTVSQGDVIFRPGDPPGQYFIIMDGEVEVRSEGYGADQTVTRIGPGKLFGDQAAMRGQRGALTAHAVAPTVLLAVDPDTIRDLLVSHAGPSDPQQQLPFEA